MPACMYAHYIAEFSEEDCSLVVSTTSPGIAINLHGSTPDK